MKLYTDIKKHKPKITGSIRKFGFSPEHNYYYYAYRQTPSKKCIFLDFGQKKGIMALFNKNSNVWHVANEVLAPHEERLGILFKFLDYAFAVKKAKKVVVEFGESFRKEVFRKLKDSKYRASINYSLYWPVYDVKKWDDKLGGKQWKKFRNIKNRFYGNSRISVKNSKRISKNTLKKILFSWLRRRHQRDTVDPNYYLNAIDNGFRGFDMARALSINNEVCSFSAGWKVPNSNSFYCGIGIFNYKYNDMGEFVNLEDMLHIKKMGYSEVELGGSDKAILQFKKKFRPTKIYKTHIFSISRK